MTDPAAVCPFVEDADIEARYLSGQLAEEEAEAFEAHYFSCDRCFALVHQGADIRAALHAAPPASRPRARRGWWRSLAAAVVVLAVGGGVWRTLHRGAATEAPVVADSNALRGSQSGFTIHVSAADPALLVSWPPRTGARTYRLRLLGADGSLLYEHEYADTIVRLPVASLQAGRGEDATYVQVQALGALRDVIATSPLARAPSARAAP